jgi:hypothetical protein
MTLNLLANFNIIIFLFSCLIDSASPSLKVGYVIPSCKDLHFRKHHVVSSNVGMQSIGTLGHLVLTIMILVKGPCHNLIFLCPLQLKRKGKWIVNKL